MLLTGPGSTDARCPGCGCVGRFVSDRTIRAILDPGATKKLLAVERRFCRTPRCEVLYYGDDGRIAPKSASRVRVGVKETRDPVPLCYCLGLECADVEREIARAGHSTIAARVIAAVRSGRAACEVLNPLGACCLGEVKRAVRKIASAARVTRAGRK